MKKRIIFICGIIILSLSSVAQAYVIDGDLSDWGVNPGAFGTTWWVPYSGIYYTAEDQDPNIDYLNPGSGGQPYDAEAVYIDFDNNNLYYSVVTGMPSSGAWDGSSIVLPGDLAFNFANQGYQYGIGISQFWPGTGTQAGGLYAVNPANWSWSFYDPTVPTKINFVDGVYTYLLANGSIAYTDIGNGHYVIEGSIPLSAFGANWGLPFTVSWTQTCGNDLIMLNVPIPEPASLSLLALGLSLALISHGKRFKNRIRGR